MSRRRASGAAGEKDAGQPAQTGAADGGHDSLAGGVSKAGQEVSPQLTADEPKNPLGTSGFVIPVALHPDVDGTREVEMGPSEPDGTQKNGMVIELPPGVVLTQPIYVGRIVAVEDPVAPLPWKCEVCGGYVRAAICATDGQRRPEVQS